MTQTELSAVAGDHSGDFDQIQLNDERENGGSRSVVQRALTILATFDYGRERQSLSEISRRAGLPIATTYRIVQRLAQWGALERSSGGSYRVGLRLWQIGSLASRSTDLQHVARPYMQDLFQLTRLNVHLAIRDGVDLVSVEHFRAAENHDDSFRFVGRAHSDKLHSTAIGLVLLAHAPGEVIRQVLAGPLPKFTANTCVDGAALEKLLGDIRRQGYAVSDRQTKVEHLGVAAPIMGPSGTVVAALSLTSTRRAFSVDSSAQSVVLAANGIARALREAWVNGNGRGTASRPA